MPEYSDDQIESAIADLLAAGQIEERIDPATGAKEYRLTPAGEAAADRMGERDQAVLLLTTVRTRDPLDSDGDESEENWAARHTDRLRETTVQASLDGFAIEACSHAIGAWARDTVVILRKRRTDAS